MNDLESSRPSTQQISQNAALQIYTLGGFNVFRKGVLIESHEWSREKALHLFQFLVTMRDYKYHKEQIIDQLWPELDPSSGDRDFKVALNAMNKALEPARKPRSQPRFIVRNELLYQLDTNNIWIDADDFEILVKQGNSHLHESPELAIIYYKKSLNLYRGQYIPERRYEDWTSSERERLTMIALGTMTTLAQLLLDTNPLESIMLTQSVISTEPAWEDAYRIQMMAFFKQGNRPMAMRTFEICSLSLHENYGVDPLPETQQLFHHIVNSPNP